MKDEFANTDFVNYLMNFCYKDCKEIYKESRLKQILLSDSKNIESIYRHVKESSNEKEYYLEISRLYKSFLFSYDENIIDLFKSLGIGDDCISKRDFIDLRELYDWCGSLFINGMHFQVNALLNWIKAELTFRVFKKINESHKLSGELREYEKDRLVNQEEIEVDNFRKRFKYYQKENALPKNNFENELYQSISQLKELFENLNDPEVKNIDL